MLLYDTVINFNQFGLDLLYYLLIGTGIAILSRRNAIISILYLILLYVWLSLYLYNIGLGVIGLLYLLIYVGAIAILFLFILSLMNLKLSELSSANSKPDYILIFMTLLNVIFILSYIYTKLTLNLQSDIIIKIFNTIFFINKDVLPISDNISIFESSNLFTINNLLVTNWSNIGQLTEMRVIGELLYTEYAILFIILGLILLLSILSAIILLYNTTSKTI